jgi:hypothetical protein
MLSWRPPISMLGNGDRISLPFRLPDHLKIDAVD